MSESVAEPKKPRGKRFKKTKLKDTVVTSDAATSRWQAASRRRVVGFIILGLVLLGAALAVFFYLNRETNESIIADSTVTKAAEDPKSTIADLQKVDESKASEKELAQIYAVRGHALQNSGDFALAIAAYEKSLSYDGKQFDLYEPLANAALATGNNKKAAEYFRKQADYFRNEGKHLPDASGRAVESEQIAENILKQS